MFFCALLSSLEARAQEPDADARAAAVLGRKAFEAGDFDTAILRYEEARQLKAAPGLLFNLAQSHRRAGHTGLAAFYFRGYLETNPAEPQARIVEALLQRVQAERQVEVELERLEVEKNRLVVAREQLSIALRVELSPPPPVTSRWWFWTIIGVVVSENLSLELVKGESFPFA